MGNILIICFLQVSADHFQGSCKPPLVCWPHVGNHWTSRFFWLTFLCIRVRNVHCYGFSVIILLIISFLLMSLNLKNMVFYKIVGPNLNFQLHFIKFLYYHGYVNFLVKNRQRTFAKHNVKKNWIHQLNPV